VERLRLTRRCAGVLHVLLLSACEVGKSSPLEPEPGNGPNDGDAPRACLAEQHPILFQSTRGASGFVLQLFAMKADGTDPIRVSQDGNHYRSAWSPDGRVIAFRHTGASAGLTVVPSELVLLAPDSGERVTLFEDESSPKFSAYYYRPDGPSWSPDGRRLAFATESGRGSLWIWLLSRSGGQSYPLMSDLQAPHYDPSFAPGAPERLAYVADIDGSQDVWVVDVAEPTQRQNLTQGRFSRPRSPSWSPDGTRLAFSSLQDDSPVEEIFILDVASGAATRLGGGGGPAFTPVWSPDGRSLLVASRRPLPGETEPLDSADIWRVWLSDSNPAEPLTHHEGSNAGPAWYGGDHCGGGDAS
jgi:Tol biopolymer transport system component